MPIPLVRFLGFVAIVGIYATILWVVSTDDRKCSLERNMAKK